MTFPPVIDADTIESLRALGGKDDDFLGEIIGIFLNDMPARLSELESGLAATDTAKLLRAAHSIKGSAANVGALRLQSAAERLESLGRQLGPDGLAAQLAEVRGEFAAAREELSKYR